MALKIRRFLILLAHKPLPALVAVMGLGIVLSGHFDLTLTSMEQYIARLLMVLPNLLTDVLTLLVLHFTA